MRRRWATTIAAYCAIGSAACNGRVFESVGDPSECAASFEAACLAAEAPVAAEAIQVGVAGVAVLQSDAGLGPDCFPCRFTSSVIDLFATEVLVANAEEAEPVVTGTPTSVNVNERYEIEQPAGTYLLCVGTECAGVRVDDGEVATANVIERMGSASIFTFAADGSAGPPSFEVARP